MTPWVLIIIMFDGGPHSVDFIDEASCRKAEAYAERFQGTHASCFKRKEYELANDYGTH